MTDYPKVEFSAPDACYITIKGRVFYIDMSLDTPCVSTWTDLPAFKYVVDLVPFQAPKKSWSAKKSLTLRERGLACQEALEDE